MAHRIRSILTASALVALPLATADAQTLVGSTTPTTFSGTGLGSVATLLTLNSQGNNTLETGCVGRNAGGDFFGPTGSGPCVAGTATDVQTGASQSQTQLLSALGISSSSQFGILFNATEPGNAAQNGVTVQSLTASFYSSAGSLLGSVNLGSPITFANTLTGVGNSGFLFTISPDASANLFAAGTRVGLSASVGCGQDGQSATCQAATGGNDTFFLVNRGGAGGGAGTVVPEPSTYALLGTGLLAIGGLARRRRQG